MEERDKTNKELASESLPEVHNDAPGRKRIRHTSEILYKKGESKKITDIVIMMLSTNILPFYAEFSTFINYYESTNVPTCGVNITKEGMNFYWNRKFVDSLTDPEMLFILLHENFHLLFDHTKRSIFYNKEFANVAQDMIINQIIHDDIVKQFENTQHKKGLISIPKTHEEYVLDTDGNPILDATGNKVKNPYYEQNTAMFIPKEYEGEAIFESLYEWLRDKYDEYKEKKRSQNGGDGQDSKQDQQGGQQEGQQNQQGGQQSGQSGQGGQQDGQSGQPNQSGQSGDSSSQGDLGDGQGGGQNEQGDQEGNGNDGSCNGKGNPSKPGYGPYGRNGAEMRSLESIFDSIDKGEELTLDSHIDDDVQEDSRKSIVNDFMQRLKNRGLMTSDIEATLNKLRKSKKDYLKEIKRTISNHIIGNSKRKSITRPNRRGIEGLKGKKKYKNVINTVLDTSGSMGGDFERVLSYVFQNDIHINLIQIDTEVKEVKNIKNKRDLQKVVIKGLGGTVLQPAIDYITDETNKINRFNTLVLTDGYTDTLNFSNMHGKVLILTTAKSPNLKDPKGIAKVIYIDTKDSLHGS